MYSVYSENNSDGYNKLFQNNSGHKTTVLDNFIENIKNIHTTIICNEFKS